MQTEVALKWSREKTAWYFNCPKQTLATWDCTGRYKLNPHKDGKEIYYHVSDLEKFIGTQITSDERLLNREEAARYINRAPSSLATWAVSNRHRLNPLKVGGLVRYSKSDLDRFNDNQQKP